VSHALAVTVLALISACGAKPGPEPSRPAEPAGPPDRVTVPLHVEGNRPFIDVTFRKPDGSKRSARFLVDSGGGGFLIAEPIARELGLTLGEAVSEGDAKLAQVTSPVQAFVGDLPLELDPKRILVMIGKDRLLPPAAPERGDGMFPGHVLARYHVVFDYLEKKFTLATPGVLRPEGEPMPMPVAEGSGFPRTEIQVDGATLGVLLDTGASFTMMSDALITPWRAAHPDWEWHAGAVGEAATLGGPTTQTIILPRIVWGTFELPQVGVADRKDGVFERWMSSMMTAPIVGALAGNVLEQFRVELDYKNQKLYLKR